MFTLTSMRRLAATALSAGMVVALTATAAPATTSDPAASPPAGVASATAPPDRAEPAAVGDAPAADDVPAPATDDVGPATATATDDVAPEREPALEPLTTRAAAVPPMPPQRYNGDVRGVVGAWGGFRNGEIPTSRLCSPATSNRHYFRCDAAEAFNQMNNAFRAAFGRNLAITSTYRTYAQQVALKAQKPVLAATPGTSNHGWGLAVDLSGGIQTFGSPEHNWMRSHANTYGFFHPRWAQISGSLPEAWHWEYAGVVASGDARHARALGMELVRGRGWNSAAERSCLADLWQRTSGWNHRFVAGDRAGIAGTDMRAVFGPGWRSSRDATAFQENPVVQVERGLAEVTDRFGGACRALTGKPLAQIRPLSAASVEAGGTARVRAATVGDFAWTATITDPRTRVHVTELAGEARESTGGLTIAWDTRTAAGRVVGPGSYEVTVRGTTTDGESVAARSVRVEVTGSQRPPTVQPTPLRGNLRFVPITPARVLDTRPEVQSLGASSRLDVTVAGVGGVPANAKAVAVNVTAVGASRTSYVRAWPAGMPEPESSVLNVDVRRAEAAAGAVIGVGGAGKISLSNHHGSLHLLVDVTGYFVESGGVGYAPLRKADRVVDTRAAGGERLTHGGVRTITVGGRGGVPADASAVVVNVTSVRAGGNGYVAVVPQGTKPSTSSVNHLPGQDVANRVTVALRNGKVDVHHAGAAGHVVVDVVGWYGTSAAARFTPVAPVRAADTRRPGESALGSREVRTLPLVAPTGVPADAIAATVTLTTTQQTAFATHLIAWAAGAEKPSTSDLNTGAGRDQANNAVVGLGADGAVNVYNDSGSTHVVMDVTGYFR